MSDFSALGGNIYEAAQASVFEALGTMAVMKNVPLTPELREQMAEHVLDSMNYADIYELSGLDKNGLATMTRAVNVHLDAVTLVRLRALIASVEGKDDLNDPVVSTILDDIMRRFEASLENKGCARWPVPGNLVWDHYAGKLRGPTLAVREDGTVVTRWWLGMLEFHRDPKEGPANIEECGTHRREEYWVKGELHRDAGDGPAIIDTNYKGYDLYAEEHIEHGKWHRPAELGPAITHTDRAGRRVLEIYAKEGMLHRDPKEGPAWFEIRDARTMKDTPDNTTVIKYAWSGVNHRDEEDGPAILTRHNISGVALQEQYWRNGVLHREHGPASVERGADGTVIFEAWYRDGDMHRDPAEGPAFIWRAGEDGITREEFYVGGVLLNASLGPAIIRRDRSGKVVEEEYWDGDRETTGHLPVSAEAHAS